MVASWVLCCVMWGSEPEPIRVESALLTIAEQAEVPSRDAGQLQELLAREGMIVNRGDRLARLDDAESSLGVAKAKADLQRAEKLATNDIKIRMSTMDLEFARHEMERAIAAEKKLPRSVSQAELDRLRLNGRRATLEVEQAKFDLENAQLLTSQFQTEVQLAEAKLARREVVAPIAGVVVAVPKRLGEWVEAGQPIARILALDQLRAEFFLPAAQATPELVGRSVQFQAAPPAGEMREFPGRIAVVSPEIDPLNGQVRVWAEIENKDRQLRPGLAGSLVIQP